MKRGERRIRRTAILSVLLAAAAALMIGTAKADRLELPEDLQFIEEEAFAGDQSLGEVILPEGLTAIGSKAFYDTSVTSVYFPEGLLYDNIAADAFEESLNVTGWGKPDTDAARYCADHDIPYLVQSTPLEEFTFEFPNEREATLVSWNVQRAVLGTQIIIPRMADETHVITRIGDNAFKGQYSITSVYFPDSIISIGDCAFEGLYYLQRVVLPENLTELGACAFSGCGLTEIVFNQKLKIIYNGAFSNNSHLSYVNLPDSVEEFRAGDYRPNTGVFAYCNSEDFSFHYPANLRIAGFENGDRPEHFVGCGLGRVVIPEGITEIPDGLFYYASGLTELVLPSTLERIGSYAFYHCHTLQQVEFGGGNASHLAEIGEHAFSYCAVTGLSLPDSVSDIRPYAFEFCSSLSEIHLPKNLTVLNFRVFDSCKSLTSLILPDGLTTFINGALFRTDALEMVYFPESVTECGSYSSTTVYTSYSLEKIRYNIGIPKGVEIWTEYGTEIAAYAVRMNLPYYYLSLTGGHLPGASVYQGDEDIFAGEIRSNVSIRQVEAVLRDADGSEIKSVSVAPNTTRYNMSGRIRSELGLENLETGQYHLYLYAETDKSAECYMNGSFRVETAPFRVWIQKFSPYSFAEEGTNDQIDGVVYANYPMTRVEMKVIRENETVFERAAQPQALTCDLEAFEFNIADLEPGNYQITITVQGEGQTLVAGKGELLISAAHPEAGTINETSLRSFISNSDNRYFFIRTFASVGSMKIRALEEGSKGLAGFKNGMNMFFSNYQDFFNSISRDLLGGLGSGGLGSRFYVDLAKEEIKALISDAGPDLYDETDGSWNEVSETVRTAFANGDPLSRDMFDFMTGSIPEWVGEFITIYNALTGEEFDKYDSLGRSSGYCSIIADCSVSFAKANATLDRLQNSCTYGGEYAGYYQTAVRELRKEYQDHFSYEFYNLLKLGFEQIDVILDNLDLGKTELMKKLPVSGLLKSIDLANLFYRVLGYAGVYDEADDFVDYLMQVESYFAAEKSYEDAFVKLSVSAASGTSFRDQDISSLDACYRFTKYCAIRAMEKLLGMKQAGYDYLAAISEEEIQGILDLLNDTPCPYMT